MNTIRSTVTKRDAQRFLAALRAQFRAYCTDEHGKPSGPQPELREDWAWCGSPAKWSIVWEEGPYDWAILFPFGGRDEEFGFNHPDVSARLPQGLYAEAITGWAVAIYPI